MNTVTNLTGTFRYAYNWPRYRPGEVKAAGENRPLYVLFLMEVANLPFFVAAFIVGWFVGVGKYAVSQFS